MPDVVSPEFKKLKEMIYEDRLSFYVMLKERASKDLYLFNKYVLDAEKGDNNFAKLAPFQKELCHFIQDRTDKKKLVLIPRSHLKTKLVSVGYPVMKIINNPEIRILIYSATWQTAVDIQTNIQKTLQASEKINAIWGNDLKIAEATIWSQDRTKLVQNKKREPTVTAAGITNNLVGGHYDLIIMDDVVNRDNVSTMDQISNVIQRFKDAQDLLEPGGELIVVGTRWHDSDLYGWILDHDNEILHDFLVLTMEAYTGNIMTGQDFQALWPGKWSREALLSKLRAEGWAHFSAQYMNNPVPEEDAIFKRDWLKYYFQDDVRGKFFNYFCLIDPAISTAKDADYTAMVIIGVDEFSNIYVRDITRARLLPNQIIEEIFRLRDKWHLTDVAMEQVAFQKVLGYSLREDIRFKQKPFHITELKPNERTKDQRIKGLQPLYENGKIFHDKALSNNIYLEDELVRFPRSSHDDIIDALAYAPDIIYPAKQKSEERTRHKFLY